MKTWEMSSGADHLLTQINFTFVHNHSLSWPALDQGIRRAKNSLPEVTVETRLALTRTSTLAYGPNSENAALGRLNNCIMAQCRRCSWVRAAEAVSTVANSVRDVDGLKKKDLS